ncbi:hypothetical protein N7U66_15425 [Lacinutrix neustonica]|uniref:Lipoprotein n=1 Tax=Lacinutrix neustonica TaxID=2980107 RepID=A0A9E8MV02_9FLAO|nr:hypothetical protein [Lacinutrix neustonica]WAC01419.1 hypothetical protein N7U66_15425 [Lacinutrix neustonica]
MQQLKIMKFIGVLALIISLIGCTEEPKLSKANKILNMLSENHVEKQILNIKTDSFVISKNGLKYVFKKA